MHCVCDLIPPLSVKTEVVVLRHRKERYRSSNTGGLLVRATGGRLIEVGGGGADQQPQEIPMDWLDERCVLVFPWGPQRPLPENPRLVLLDGTWKQAKKMYQRLPGLSLLPVLGIEAGGRPHRMRISTVDGGLSTLEAGALALEKLEGPEIAEPLLQLFDRMTERQLRLRGVWPESDL